MKRFLAALLIIAATLTAPAADGKNLFRQNCAACHKMGSRMVGPDLTGIDKKRDRQWLKDFIRSPQSLIRSGDTAAINAYNAYGKIIMPDQAHLSDGDIESLLEFIKTSAGVEQISVTGKDAPISYARPRATETRPGIAEKARLESEFFMMGSIVALLFLSIAFAAITYRMAKKLYLTENMR